MVNDIDAILTEYCRFVVRKYMYLIYHNMGRRYQRAWSKDIPPSPHDVDVIRILNRNTNGVK